MISTRRGRARRRTHSETWGRWTNNSTHQIEATLQRALLEFNRGQESRNLTSDSWANMMRENGGVRRRATSTSNIENDQNHHGISRQASVSIFDVGFDFDSDSDLESRDLSSRFDRAPRQTKIICAIGPACRDVSTLTEMLDAGMNVARLNFSHGTLEYHAESVRNLRSALAARPETRCAVLMDTKGPEIRTGKLKDGSTVQIYAGQLLLISTNSKLEGHAHCITCTYHGLATSTCPGATLLCADGSLSFDIVYCAPEGGQIPPDFFVKEMMVKQEREVKEEREKEKKKEEDEDEDEDEEEEGTTAAAENDDETSYTWIQSPYVVVVVKNDGVLGENKNMCLPGIEIPSNMLPSLTDKDRFDLMNFTYQHNVDVVSCSLVRSASDVREVRACLSTAREAYIQQMKETKGTSQTILEFDDKEETRTKIIRIHAKIESLQALQNVDEIIQEADGVHVSRGDLGMALPLHKVFLAQKMIILRARRYGKPVVTSTEMLESMISNLRPSHAECTDVANAVLDGTDAMMLSGECARGDHPVGSVRMMSRIARAAESCVDYHSEFLAMRQLCSSEGIMETKSEVVAAAAADTTFKLGAKLILVFTRCGHLPIQVAKCRPGVPIIALTLSGSQYKEGVANQLGSLSRGVYGWTYTMYNDINDNDNKDKVTAAAAEQSNFPYSVLSEIMERAAVLGWIVKRDAVVSLWARSDSDHIDRVVDKDAVVEYVQSVNYY